MNSFDPALISIVMPCHNAAPYVQEAIESVLLQSYRPLELIVVNDGSTDASTTILQKLAAAHPQHIRLLYQNRGGPYAARNYGLTHARGNFVAFLDADDYWHRNALMRLHSALMSARADLAYCGWQNVGAAAENTQPHIPPVVEGDALVTHFLNACPWPINAVLAQRRLIDNLHGFSERRITAMDYDLWLRMLTLQPALVRVPEVLAFYRHYPRPQNPIPRWRQVFDAVAVRRDFVKHRSPLSMHLTLAQRNALVYDSLLSEAYRCHWQRDTASSRQLFIQAFFHADWKVRDLKYLLTSFMPAALFEGFIRFIDTRRKARSAP